MIMPEHVTFPTVLALVRFQSPMSVHVLIKGLLSSECFPTFLTYKRPFTRVYPLVTFHVTYTKQTVKRDSLYCHRFTDSIISLYIYSLPFVRNLNWQSVHWYFRSPACRCSWSRSWDFCLNDLPHWLHKCARWFRCMAMWDWSMLVCEKAFRHTEHL